MKHLWVDIKCILAAFILTALLSILAACFIYFTPASEDLMRPIGTVILIIGVLSAGAMAGKVFGTHGMLQGLRIGILAASFMILASLLLSAESLTIGQILSTLLITLPSGAVGGIFGVGFKQ